MQKTGQDISPTNTLSLRTSAILKVRLMPVSSIFSRLHMSHPDVHQLYQMMLDYPRRAAKGLRPALCMLMCEAFGGDSQRAVNTAASLELLQNWLLIHDDIETGPNSVEVSHVFIKSTGFRWRSMSVMRSTARCGKCCTEIPKFLGHELAFRILSEFIQLSNQVVEGQHIELSWVSDNRWNLDEDDYLTMCIQKTAWYTCITPCRVGAIIGGASETEIDGLVELGKEIGVAFQIQDDVLNLIGDVGRYGKRSQVILVRANVPSFSSTLLMSAPLPKHSM